MTIKFLITLGKRGNEIREMLVQVYRDNAMKETAVYRDNAMKKTAVYNVYNVFLRGEKVSLMKRDQDSQQQAELKKTLQMFVKLCVKIIG